MASKDQSSPKTISVPAAGKEYFGLAKNAAYAAAARGEIPVIRIGGRLRVPVIQLERLLRGDKPVDAPG
jgi:Helix-turn-helix domain